MPPTMMMKVAARVHQCQLSLFPHQSSRFHTTMSQCQWPRRKSGGGASKRPTPHSWAPKRVTRTSIRDDVEKLYEQAIKMSAKNTWDVQVLVDDREHDAEFEAMLQRLKPHGLVKREHMRASDLIFLFRKKMFRPVERKRLDDAVSSVTDGRLSKQKVSMELLFREIREAPWKKGRCIVLIEKLNHTRTGLVDDDEEQQDDLHWLFGDEECYDGQSLDRATIMGLQVNKIVRDEFQIFQTESVLYTIMFVLKVLLAMDKFGQKCWDQVSDQQDFDLHAMEDAHLELTPDQQATFLTAQQGVNARQELMQNPELAQLSEHTANFALQIKQFKGMSMPAALSLVRMYNSPKAWAAFLNENEQNPQAVVDTIGPVPVCESGKRARKFGYALAVKLFNHHHHTNFIVKNKKVRIPVNADERGDDDDVDAVDV